jgi:CHRD domain-containing protein
MLRRQIAFGAIAVLLAGCTSDKPVPTAFEVRAPLFAVDATMDANLGTHLTGDEEFCPACSTSTPADSRAQGQAIFRVSADGSTVDFRLIASNINNAFMAHIHCGASGTNGPIRMWLYPGTPGPTGTPGPPASGRHNGVLSSGTFSPTGVTCPNGMSLLSQIRAGLTYVNVHTNDGDAVANEGPGDFPGGEIRGQLGDKNN